MKVLFVMINISDNKWIIRFYFLFMVDDTRSTLRFVSHKICFETVINRFLIIFCISIFLLRRTFILDTRFTKWVLKCVGLSVGLCLSIFEYLKRLLIGISWNFAWSWESIKYKKWHGRNWKKIIKCSKTFPG